MALDGVYHQHLDSCTRCANNPFNLCPVGAKLLEEEFCSSGIRIGVGGGVGERDRDPRAEDQLRCELASAKQVIAQLQETVAVLEAEKTVEHAQAQRYYELCMEALAERDALRQRLKEQLS